MAAVRFRLAAALRHRPGSTVGSAIVVALVLAIVLFLAAGAVRTMSLSDRFVEWEGGAVDVLVEQAMGEPLTDQIDALPSVARVRSATFAFAGLAPPGTNEQLQALVFVGDHAGFGTRLYTGREPSAPDEFAATSSFLDATGARLGDRFDLFTITKEAALVDGFDARFSDVPTTVGVELVGAFTGPVELDDDIPVTIFPSSMRDVADVGVATTQHVVGLTPGSTRGDLRTGLDEIGSQEGATFAVKVAQPVPRDVRNAVAARGAGIAVVAAIAAAAAIVVLGQLLGRRARTSTSGRRLMAGIGMTPRQIVLDSVAQGSLPVLVGAPIGGVVAVVASQWFPLGFAAPLEVDDGIRLEPVVHLVGPVVLVVTIVAWLTVAILADGRETRTALRSTFADSIAERTTSARFATAVRFAFVRQPRDPSSPRPALAGLTVVLASLVASVTFGASVDRVISTPERWSSGADLALGQGGFLSEQDVELLATDPDVIAATLAKTLAVTDERTGLGIDLTGLEPLRGSITAPLLDGRRPVSPDEVALGRITADRSGLGVGDSLSVIDDAGRSSTLRVTGIVVVESRDGGDGVGVGGVVTFAGLRRFDPDARPATAFLRVRGGADGPAAARLAAALERDPSGSDEMPTSIAKLEQVRTLPYVIAGILAALAVLALAHQLLTSARLRRFDLGVLRSVGADRRWVGAVVHWQASLVACTVVAASIPLGFFFGRAVYGRFIDGFGVARDATVSGAWLLATLGAVLALANVVALVPALRVRRSHVARDLTRE